jgi:hypothetical protein
MVWVGRAAHYNIAVEFSDVLSLLLAEIDKRRKRGRAAGSQTTGNPKESSADPQPPFLLLITDFIKSVGHSGCAPRRVLENSLACGIMRIVIRARTYGSYAFNYSLGGFCQPTRRGLGCEPEWHAGS